MKRKSLLIIGLAMILVLSLVLACASPASAPGKTEKTSIQLFAGRPGDSWTVLSEAMAIMINEDSEWLRATVVATGGTSDGPKVLLEEPEKRDHRLAIWRSQDQPGTYRKDTDLKPQFIASIAKMPMVWATYDPNIKSIEDFAGKNVGLPRTIPGYWDSFEQSLIDAGIRDTINGVHGGFAANKAALLDGKVDIAHTTFNVMSPEKMGPGSHMVEMATRKPLYPIDYTKERIERVAATLGFPPLWLEVPAGSLPNQPEVIYVIAYSFEWYSGSELPDEVAYEIAKITYEHAAKGDFVKYHAMGEVLTADSVWRSVWQTPEEIELWYHPGALKFYREIGVL